MKVLTPEKAARRTTILRLNILLGFIVLAVSVFFMITNDYATLAERKAADSVFNLMIIGSVLYMAIIWFACVFSRPFWKPESRT